MEHDRYQSRISKNTSRWCVGSTGHCADLSLRAAFQNVKIRKVPRVGNHGERGTTNVTRISYASRGSPVSINPSRRSSRCFSRCSTMFWISDDTWDTRRLGDRMHCETHVLGKREAINVNVEKCFKSGCKRRIKETVKISAKMSNFSHIFFNKLFSSAPFELDIMFFIRVKKSLNICLCADQHSQCICDRANVE
jgi:hypothetical protein